MFAVSSLTTAVIVFFVLTVVWQNDRRSLPPGPKPFPVLGNIRDFKLKEFWLTVTEWARRYGDVCYLRVLNWSVVFVSSADAAVELLEKRGAIYSDRPTLQMSGELCGVEKLVPLSKYNETFKRQRRYIQQTLGPRVIPTYHDMIQRESASLLLALVDSPSQYQAQIRKYAGGLTLSVVYGYQADRIDDPFLRIAEDCLAILANEIASGSGIWPVDIFPFLRYFPEWLPGLAFKKKAAKWKVKMIDFVDRPFLHAKASLNNGTILNSFCSKLLSREDLDEKMEDEIKYSANSMFAASADTTVTSISQFILAMLMYPEVMERAQDELDSVVGQDRLPDFDDRHNLPYVEAVMSEVWRWGTPVPLNLPHYLVQDDYYRGMFIPKNCIVVVNIWAILHDENTFPRPDVFDPERYGSAVSSELKAKRDPRQYIFGFGRRRCPGADLVESSIWLLIASMLATLDIKKATDSAGNVIEPEVQYNNSTFR
ncbi:hypothetical protein VNI00_002922 [Paramarasmius palmivorus]|uniref:Cytochrome P450 n=1 Tax=Paramarasmius palmivorus TaxID=297713 RepID=A0AAW0DYU7_9AGAR